MPLPTKIFGLCHLWHCSSFEQCDTIISRQLANAQTRSRRECHADAASSELCCIWAYRRNTRIHGLWTAIRGPCSSFNPLGQESRTGQAAQDQQAVSMWLDSVSMEIEITDKGADPADSGCEGWWWAIRVEKERSDKNPEQQEKWIFGQAGQRH